MDIVFGIIFEPHPLLGPISETFFWTCSPKRTLKLNFGCSGTFGVVTHACNNAYAEAPHVIAVVIPVLRCTQLTLDGPSVGPQYRAWSPEP